MLQRGCLCSFPVTISESGIIAKQAKFGKPNNVLNTVDDNKRRQGLHKQKRIDQLINYKDNRVATLQDFKLWLYETNIITKDEAVNICSAANFDRLTMNLLTQKYITTNKKSYRRLLQELSDNTELNYWFPPAQYMTISESTNAIVLWLHQQEFDIKHFVTDIITIMDRMKAKQNYLPGS